MLSAAIDILMCVFFTFAVYHAATSHAAKVVPVLSARADPALVAAMPEPERLGLVWAILERQITTKDLLILLALALSLAVTWLANRALRATLQTAHAELLKDQTPDFTSVNWTDMAGRLPSKATWIDLGCKRNHAVVTLIGKLYPSGGLSRLTLVDSHAAADARATEIATIRAQGVDVQPLRQGPGAWRGLGSAINSLVVSLCHVCYDVNVAASALRFLDACPKGTMALLQFTSDASYYRVLSTTQANRLSAPYAFHAMHPTLLNDLLSRGWTIDRDATLQQQRDLSPAANEKLVKWIDARYGEDSGDAIERYANGMAAAGVKTLRNWDRLVLLKKLKGQEPPPPPPPPAPEA
jgi:hypothetical protein